MVLYLSYNDDVCTSDAIAWAKTCALDQYGRPIGAGINFCSSLLDSKYWKQDVMITLHEITHTLIMSSGLWAKFKDSNGDTIPKDDVLKTITLANGHNQTFIITDKVKSLAQEHFGCYNESIMPGLPIEDDLGVGSAGSHWEVE